MKKILTIAATAGLLSALAGSAQAQVVNFPGSVTQSCNVTASADGELTENATPATSLTTITPGTVTVVCNTDTSTLTLADGGSVLQAQTPAPTVAFQFASGGTGIYSTVTSGVTSPSAGATTAVAGDVANVSSTVTAATGKLLKAGAYNVVVNATIAP